MRAAALALGPRARARARDWRAATRRRRRGGRLSRHRKGVGREGGLVLLDLGDDVVSDEFGEHVVDVARGDVVAQGVFAQLLPVVHQVDLAGVIARMAELVGLLSKLVATGRVKFAGLGFGAVEFGDAVDWAEHQNAINPRGGAKGGERRQAEAEA